MLCTVCHGQRLIFRQSKVETCPECGGMGEIHCCDGLQEQPLEPPDLRPHRPAGKQPVDPQPENG